MEGSSQSQQQNETQPAVIHSEDHFGTDHQQIGQPDTQQNLQQLNARREPVELDENAENGFYFR